MASFVYADEKMNHICAMGMMNSESTAVEL